MAFVPGYRKDIFISYAHVDNEPMSGVSSGWVSTLAHNIENHLRAKLGNVNVELWMDHIELVGNMPLKRQIVEALEGTAVFLVVVSPGYLDSDWCKEEREKFLELIKVRTDSDSRVFLIERDKVERSDFPAEFGELIPYYFWAPDKKTKTPQTLGWPEPTSADRDYYQELNRLCVALKEELKRLRASGLHRPQGGEAEGAQQEAPAGVTTAPGAAGAPEEPPAEAAAAASPQEDAPARPAVYLAEVSDDLKLRRQEVRDYLTSEGLQVLPDKWQSYETLTAFEEALDSDLSRCAVFAQLLSDDPGEARPFGQEFSYARLQYEHALRAGKSVLQWRDPKLDVGAVPDKAQGELLEGPTVLAVGLEEFKRTVAKAAGPPPGAEEAARPDAEEEFKFVYIYADELDRERALELVQSDSWDKDIGHVLCTSRKGEDPEAVRELIKFNLLNLDCLAALVFYGLSGPTPVQFQLIQYSRTLGNRRRPPLQVAIYDSPPPPPSKHEVAFGFPNLKLRTLNCRNGNQKELSEFLRSLKR